MGNEVKCLVHFGKQQSEGRALLETSEILFRGEFRLKIPFSTIKSAKAVDGELRLQIPEGLAVFHLGAAAEKWCDKIVHPKSRLEKLGVKETDRIGVIGAFDTDFIQELKSHCRQVRLGRMNRHMEYIFQAVRTREELMNVWKCGKALQGAMALWIIYPKGQKHITENDVLAAGRKTGLKDVKVVGFSSTHTALKFVIPLSKR
jgi:hypothetical protein